ncbi:methyltransferase [Stieleria marina]|uniref:Demethylspheroidene O-methyltransferase n=1 Tax=Stieleria marina TaxID=1930275 RepID=A0A517NVA1_9BACT|nr:Demethylspheroidene O-methyltransferase [Planctomycetes bacterium K23_9]
MPRLATTPPQHDPTPIFELFRGSYGSELLTAAIAHFDIFARLERSPESLESLAAANGLQMRPANVLVTALRAMGLIGVADGKLTLTAMAQEHLVPGGMYDVGDYVGLAAQSPGVLTMVRLLKSNQPLSFDDGGAAFIYRDGMASAMEATDSARHFTLALAGRAKNVAPALAEAVDAVDAELLVDIGGGTGIYSYAILQKHPSLHAVVVDRPEVLKVAEEMAAEYGVADRVTLQPGDMFDDSMPTDADIVLLSNILHDWDVPECKKLVQRAASLLRPGGQVAIHDVFLNDEQDGPLPIALYSAALFTLTEGRAYSEAEYAAWLVEAGLTVQPRVDTLIHCGVLAGKKA